VSERRGLPQPANAALEAWSGRLRGVAAGDGPARVAWAPGRVNLIGEHTDYNEGWVLPAAVDRWVAVAGQRVQESFVTLYSAHHGGRARFPASVAALLSERRVRLPLWARYVRATLGELAKLGRWDDGRGFTAAIAGNVPVGGGLSSSAALSVACATFALALGGQTLAPLEVARACQRAEWNGAGVRVGVMDQAASVLGRPHSAILLDCRSLDYTYAPVTIPGLRMLVFDTGAPHTLAASGYNERRAQCEEAVRRLAPLIVQADPGRAVTALRDVTPADLDQFGAGLSEALLRRARHVVEEDARVLDAASALRAGDAERLGTLLDQSHTSLRDLYQVSSLELDVAVEIMRATPGVYGARMIGAGFGGSALALVRDGAIAAVQAALARDYPTRTGRRGRAHLLRIAGGPQTRVIALDTPGNHAL
jgi:galactokinase